MYFVRFLQTHQEQTAGDHVEFRLACSGELYNRAVITAGDWRKSDVTRILLEKPFSLLVASRPFNTYPQELCLRLTLTEATEQSTTGTSTPSLIFLPDDDVIEDACAILTLLSRRLISPVVKTMVKPGGRPPGKRWYDSHVPLPIVDTFKVVAWPRRPLTIKTSATGQTVTFHEPPPVGVDDRALAAFLAHLASLEHAQQIVYAARQYKTALELIEQRPETAYLALVSVVETLAGIALRGYKPEKTEQIKNKANVAKRARKLGLSEAHADALALEAAKSERWSTRKFVKFCQDYCPVSELQTRDTLFMVPDSLNPVEADFNDCVERIYSVRSTNLHSAVPFPPGAGIGTSPMLKIRELPLHPLGKLELPPATWFERVVSIAVRNFLLADRPAPFTDARSAPSSEVSLS